MVSINLPAKLQKKSFAEKQNTKKVQTIVVFLLFCLLQILGDALMGLGNARSFTFRQWIF